MDKGNKDFNHISTLHVDTVKGEDSDIISDRVSDIGSVNPKISDDPDQLSGINSVRPGGFASRQGFRGRDSRVSQQVRRTGCWICGESQHFAKSCPKQCCRRCRERGHSLRDCKSKRVLSVRVTECDGNLADESGVIISVRLNG